MTPIKESCKIEDCVPIRQEDVESTLNDIYRRLLPELNLTEDDVKPAGSAGKKAPGETSGDIDLAVDENTLISRNDFTDPEEYFDRIEEIGEKYGITTQLKRNWGWRGATFAWPIVGEDDEETGEFVQIDILTTDNMSFTQWICHYDARTDRNQELEKAAVKNTLIDAVALVFFEQVNETGYVDGIGDDEPVDVDTYHLSYKLGLMKVHRHRNMKKDGHTYSKSWNASQECVTKDPDEIVRFVFQDDSLSTEDAMTPRQVWNLIQDKFGNDREFMDRLGDEFHSVLAKGVPVPGYIEFESRSKVNENDEDDEEFEDDDDYGCEARTADEFADLLKTDAGLDAQVHEKKKGFRYIQINCQNPRETRKSLREEIGPDLGIEFIQPRKTKKDGFNLQIIVPDTEELIQVYIRKGGDFRAGRKNEIDFQGFIRKQIEKNGECHLHFTDNYGKELELDVVDVVDSAGDHGKGGKVNRSDTTLKLKDGSLYGISQKMTTATYVCKANRMFKEILFRSGQILRNYAKEHGLKPKDYMDVRITNRELIDLCWFGSDIAKGAAIIGDFMGMSSGDCQVERIIENGDKAVLDSFPIYTKWQIVNGAYTMYFHGVSKAQKSGEWVVDDVVLPGINAPMPEGKKFRTGQEEPKKRRHRRRRRRRMNEDGMMTEEEILMKEKHDNDLWDKVAWCAENHKMLWLKYETVEDGEVISRRVGPYSYRTRNTKVRGRSTYFYADDFTPGQEKGIKCFLVDNCLDAKESPNSFRPRFPVEIKQEIDRLEKQRQDAEDEKEREEKARQEQIDAKDNDGVVDDQGMDADDREEVAKIKAKSHGGDEPEVDDDTEPEEQAAPKNPTGAEPKKPTGAEPKPAVKPATHQMGQKGKEDAKDDIEVKNAKDKPLPPPPPPPKKDEPQKNEPETQDNSVTVDTDQEKDDDVKVTDEQGNDIK